MTVLIISVNAKGLTAVEVYCGDDVKYVETFQTWQQLFDTLEEYFPAYASVEVRTVWT